MFEPFFLVNIWSFRESNTYSYKKALEECESTPNRVEFSHKEAIVSLLDSFIYLVDFPEQRQYGAWWHPLFMVFLQKVIFWGFLIVSPIISMYLTVKISEQICSSHGSISGNVGSGATPLKAKNKQKLRMVSMDLLMCYVLLGM